jgi:peroxiredoxin
VRRKEARPSAEARWWRFAVGSLAGAAIRENTRAPSGVGAVSEVRMPRRALASVLLLGLFASARAEAGPAAPDFTLRDVAGQPVTLSQFHGKVIVLSFWATWCGPCRAELPHLQALWSQRAHDGLVVLSVATDDARSVAKVAPFVATHGYTFPVVLDRAATVSARYNPGRMIPLTVVIDRDFTIADTHAGFDPGDERALAATVGRLLDER